MFDRHEGTFAPTDGVAIQDTTRTGVESPAIEARQDELPAGDTNKHTSEPEFAPAVHPVVSAADVTAAEPVGNEPAEQDWHAEAGRKGARRVHQLIQAGRLYEQEHGLKSGRQRLRQLIELGKLYEQEHGLRANPGKKRPRRLSRLDREELLATFLECLVRIAKPSFRSELLRLTEALRNSEKQEHAA